jgi:hypothetical protein
MDRDVRSGGEFVLRVLLFCCRNHRQTLGLAETGEGIPLRCLDASLPAADSLKTRNLVAQTNIQPLGAEAQGACHAKYRQSFRGQPGGRCPHI